MRYQYNRDTNVVLVNYKVYSIPVTDYYLSSSKIRIQYSTLVQSSCIH